MAVNPELPAWPGLSSPGLLHEINRRGRRCLRKHMQRRSKIMNANSVVGTATNIAGRAQETFGG